MSPSPPHAQKKLGDILVECQVVTQEQVNAALAEQQRTGKLFGESLLDLGFASEDDLGWALSAQLSIPYIDINREMVDLRAAQLLGPELMRRHHVLPLVQVGDALTVVVADPTNRDAVREVERATGLTVQTSIASPRRIARVLDELLGSEDRTPGEPGDILLAEITRPWLDEEGRGRGRPNPLSGLFARALTENVTEIHLEPSDSRVRVRFRRDGRLTEEPEMLRADFDALLNRLRLGLPRDSSPAAGLCSWQSQVALDSGLMELALTLLPSPHGGALVLEIRPVMGRQVTLPDLGLTPDETHRLRAGLESGSGLLLVVGPRGAAPVAVLTALLKEVDAATRRVVALGPGLAGPPEGVMYLSPAPVGNPLSTIRDQLYSAPWVDVLALDDIKPGAECNAAATAAVAGRLILARMDSPDAVTALATVMETAASRPFTARALIGIIETSESPAGRPRAAFLSLSGDLAGATEKTTSVTQLALAARAEGFLPLSDRHTGVGPPLPSTLERSPGNETGRAAA